jgi:riboflavin kinase/FMN adenylyltransferase
MRRAGVQRIVMLTFDEEMRSMSAAQFATTVLLEGLQTKGLLLGFDSAMGKDREGTPERFRDLGKTLGFAVRTGRPVEVDGNPVSSTAIRNAITTGDLDQAYRLLGRRAAVFGEVVHGDHRGRDLGFPTANIRPQCQALPPEGVYAVEILHEGEQHFGVANLGVRPTFEERGDAAPTLEVHFLRGARGDSATELDLYGATLEVAFAKRLRGERQFADAAELKTQIAEDIRTARQVLGA